MVDEASLLREETFLGAPADAFGPAWDSSPAIVVVTLGPDHRIAYQNRASRAMFGDRPPGTPLAEAYPEVTAGGLDRLDRVLATGEPLEVPRRQSDVRDLTGQCVVLRYVVAPLARAGQPPVGLVITAIDVTGEARAEAAADRSGLLAALSARLTGAADARSGLQALTDALVPHVADLAACYVIPERGRDPEPIPPQVVTVSDRLAALGPLPPPTAREQPSPWEGSLRSGEPVVVRVDAETLSLVAPDPAGADWLVRAAANSIAVAPLVVAGSLTGALLLLAAADRAPFTAADLPFLSDVTARAGAAISQVSVQRRQREAALQLQRALLPVAPPPLPGLAVAARYLAGAPDVEVGGDWWHVQDLGGGRVAVGIGDVAGRGISAAAVMGQARAAMHAAGHAQLPPVEVLALLDAQLTEVIRSGRLAEPAAPQFATACYSVVEPAAHRLRLASAGHLPPLLRRATGEVAPLRLRPAAPLGLGVGGFTETVVGFGPGDTLVMFTDGLVELPREDLDDGIAQLAAALHRAGGQPSLELLADDLLDAMTGRPGFGHDDVALILVRAAAEPS